MSRLFYIDSEITFLESGKTKQYEPSKRVASKCALH